MRPKDLPNLLFGVPRLLTEGIEMTKMIRHRVHPTSLRQYPPPSHKETLAQLFPSPLQPCSRFPTTLRDRISMLEKLVCNVERWQGM